MILFISSKVNSKSKKHKHTSNENIKSNSEKESESSTEDQLILPPVGDPALPFYVALAKLAYCPQTVIKKLSCSFCDKLVGYFNYYVHSIKDDLGRRFQFSILYNDLRREVVINFSGPTSEQGEFFNILYTQGFVAPVELKGAHIEVGFWTVYNDFIRPELITKIERLSISNRGHYNHIFVGHSFGGSIAVLAAYDLFTKGIIVSPPIVYTYGQLRIGDINFVSLINRTLQIIKVVKHNDYFTRYPNCIYFDGKYGCYDDPNLLATRLPGLDSYFSGYYSEGLITPNTFSSAAFGPQATIISNEVLSHATPVLPSPEPAIVPSISLVGDGKLYEADVHVPRLSPPDSSSLGINGFKEPLPTKPLGNLRESENINYSKRPEINTGYVKAGNENKYVSTLHNDDNKRITINSITNNNNRIFTNTNYDQKDSVIDQKDTNNVSLNKKIESNKESTYDVASSTTNNVEEKTNIKFIEKSQKSLLKLKTKHKSKKLRNILQSLGKSNLKGKNKKIVVRGTTAVGNRTINTISQTNPLPAAPFRGPLPRPTTIFNSPLPVHPMRLPTPMITRPLLPKPRVGFNSPYYTPISPISPVSPISPFSRSPIIVPRLSTLYSQPFGIEFYLGANPSKILGCDYFSGIPECEKSMQLPQRFSPNTHKYYFKTNVEFCR